LANPKAVQMRDPVQEQLEAYNARDLERFLACYAEGVVIATPDGAPLMTGKPEMRRSYGTMFKESADLHADVANRLRAGQWVVDEEHVLLNGQRLHVLVAYLVQDELIERVLMLE
jgi:hypothetical protein